MSSSSQMVRSLRSSIFMEKHRDKDLIKENLTKPPLPNKVQRKRKASDSILSSIANIALSPFYKQRHSMGSACTKGAKVNIDGLARPQHSMSPTRLSARSKVSPICTSPLTVSSNYDPKRVCKSRLSVDHITLHAHSNLTLRENTILETYVQHEEVLDGVQEDVETSQIPEAINKKYEKTSDTQIKKIKKDNYKKKLRKLSSQSLCRSETTDDIMKTQKDKQTSLPDLRSKDNEQKRVNRSRSQGDTQLKCSIGSTNLLVENKSFINRKERFESARHHSSENVFNFEKRQKRLPTLENGIQVLEADQVNYYQIMEEIGRGSFGSVCKCFCYKDNSCYAMKIISKKRLMRKNRLLARHPGNKSNPLEPLHREIAILKKMDHPNIVKLIEVIDDVQVDNVYMVFELMKDGVVIEVPTKNLIPEDRARSLFRDLLLGIEYLHYSKTIHRDIKPSNLLLDDKDHIKIADFGVSDMFEGDDDLLSKYAGSPAFQAPEVLNHGSRDKYSGKAVDVWAMGITLYCFLYGKCPFFSNNLGELCNMIKTEPVAFPDEPVVNPQTLDLISRTLSKEPKDRITVLEMKEHPWVTEGGSCPLPSTEEHCSVIQVTEEEVRNSIKIISKLSSLVLAKSILKGKSFVGSVRSKAAFKRNHSLPST